MPYIKELPKDSTSLKAKGKAADAKAPAPKLPNVGEMVERPKHKAEEQRS